MSHRHRRLHRSARPGGLLLSALLLLAVGASVAVAGCSSTDAAPSQQGPGCPAGTKECGGTCVSIAAPATGCAAASCLPCAAPFASTVCGADGACGVGACQNGRGDCDGDPTNGCEVDLRSAPLHCGACGAACAAGEVCDKGACQAAAVVQTATWLDGQRGGFCQATFGALMNLCGDVDFCADADVLREHPAGLELDVGFDWDGVDPDGTLVDVGGDCDNQRIALRIETDAAVGTHLLANGPQKGGGLTVQIAPGRHLVGYRVDAASAALFLDGRKVAEGLGAGATPKLTAACGPGFVAGQRISYWWEDKNPASVYFLRFAPFLVHLRSSPGAAAPWSLDGATSAGAGTIALFDASGASGSQWIGKGGAKIGVGKGGSAWVADTRVGCLTAPP